MADHRPRQERHVIQPTDNPSLPFGLLLAELLADLGECCGLLTVLGCGTINDAITKAHELQLTMRDVNVKNLAGRDPNEAMTYADLRNLTRERLLILVKALEDRK